MSSPFVAILAAMFATGAPRWVEQVSLEPKDVQVLKIKGPRAPKGLVLVKGNQPMTMTVSGPAELHLRLHLLTMKSGSKGRASFSLQLDDNKAAQLALPKKPHKGWKLVDHPLFGLGDVQSLSLVIPRGEHRLVIQPIETTTFGLAFKAKIGPLQSNRAMRLAGRPGSAASTAKSNVEEPPLFGPAGAIDKEPPLLGPSGEVEGHSSAERVSPRKTDPPGASPVPGPPGAPGETSAPDPTVSQQSPAIDAGREAGPTDIAQTTVDAPQEGSIPQAPPSSESAPAGEPSPEKPPSAAREPPGSEGEKPEEPAPVTPGFRFRDPIPPTVLIEGPKGGEEFALTTIEKGIRLTAVGPGAAVFELHTHRNETRPETLEPVVVALLINQVLAQTFSLEQPASTRYRPVSDEYSLSLRTSFRVPLAAGSHDLQLTLSDNAAAGLSVRVSFDDDPNPDKPTFVEEDPTLLSELGMSQAGPLPGGQLDIKAGVHGGVWIPSAVAAGGLAVNLEGYVGLPIAPIALSAGLSVGFQWLQSHHNFSDPRLPDGTAAVGATVTQLPLTVGIRWAFGGVGPLMMELGVAGGVVLGFTQAAALDATASSGAHVLPAGIFDLTALIDVGFGGLVVRATYQVADRFTAGPVRNVYASGGSVLLGYRLTYVFD